MSMKPMFRNIVPKYHFCNFFPLAVQANLLEPLLIVFIFASSPPNNTASQLSLDPAPLIPVKQLALKSSVSSYHTNQ